MPNLKIPKEQAIEKLSRQIEGIKPLMFLRRGTPEFGKWHRDTEVTLEHVFGEDSRQAKDFSKISYTLSAFSSGTPDSKFQERYTKGLESAKSVLQSIFQEMEEFWHGPATPDMQAVVDTTRVLEKLFNRFHIVARQLRSRYANRATLEIDDEYDVQDLLHALLRLEFEDVRPEEWTPSYAGKASRTDFLLKSERAFVEIKKTRKGLSDKEVGDELIIDTRRYNSHPDCGQLICFIYDPEGRIGNPRGVESDLSGNYDGLQVNVYVRPS